MTSRNLSVMYYHAQAEASGGLGALQMTPSVALRALFEQLNAYEQALVEARPADIDEVFVGPILPPHLHLRRPIGDPAHEAVAEYASFVIARAGQLTTKDTGDEGLRLEQHRRLSARITAAEHSLAIDLARLAPEIPLRGRQAHARAIWSLAAFWCDRRELIRSDGPAANELLGKRPTDEAGSILWEHAMLAMTPKNRTIDLRDEATTTDVRLGVGLELGTHSAA